jgi:hypothetical protein
MPDAKRATGLAGAAKPAARLTAAAPAALTAAVAIALCGCGSVVKPPQGHGKLDDPRTYAAGNHLKCLRQQHLPVQEVGRTGMQIGALPAGPSVWFQPTPGAAQSQQINGLSQGAEVIGAALLYPHGAGDAELKVIETCLAKGVNG